MNAVRVKNSQSVLDVNIQVNGENESLFDFALLNGISITDSLTPAQTLAYTPNNNAVASYFGNKQYHPATGVTDMQLFKEEGIDFWAIEDDFIVQEK